MSRLWTNLIRLPVRTWKGLIQLTDPAYSLQRQADRVVPGWWSAELLQKLNALPGFTSSRELHLLAYLASLAPENGAWVEIGAYKGRSTAWLMHAAERRKTMPAVVTIDPHLRDTWETFSQVVADFQLDKKGLEVRRDFSSVVGETWNQPIGFLWIDGSHEYPDVVKDIDLFVPHVVPDGYVVFDDAHGGNFPGVEQALAERMFPRSEFQHVGVVKHFEIFRRKPIEVRA